MTFATHRERQFLQGARGLAGWRCARTHERAAF